MPNTGFSGLKRGIYDVYPLGDSESTNTKPFYSEVQMREVPLASPLSPYRKDSTTLQALLLKPTTTKAHSRQNFNFSVR